MLRCSAGALREERSPKQSQETPWTQTRGRAECRRRAVFGLPPQKSQATITRIFAAGNELVRSQSRPPPSCSLASSFRLTASHRSVAQQSRPHLRRNQGDVAE